MFIGNGSEGAVLEGMIVSSNFEWYTKHAAFGATKGLQEKEQAENVYTEQMMSADCIVL